MEPSDEVEVNWNTDSEPLRTPFVCNFQKLWLKIAIIALAFAAGFTTRAILALHPNSASDKTTDSALMISRTPGNLSTDNNVSTSSNDTIVVDVHGDVVHPGVYRLSVSSRFQDAVRAAGGFRHTQDSNAVNLAEALTDGQEVVIPDASSTSRQKTADTRSEPAGQDSTEPESSGGSAEIDSTANEADKAGEQAIDLNTADAATLTTLPDIGAERAQAIVQYRKVHGSFASVNELLNVKGIGQGIFSKIQPYLVVNAK